ncbi:MAG: histidine--tRNA ligase [Bdellovibrionales bacterium]|nr:histidine--tRNA ligase [Bdellovibrionales bacterium]
MDFKKARGFQDFFEEDCLKFDNTLSELFKILKRFDFSRVEPPLLEDTNLFKRTLGSESDIVSKEMYSLQKGKENFTLRPEGTASIARMLVTQNNYRQLPLRWFYYGPMFRHERPQKGRFRQFHQLGIESLGDSQTETDVEILSMAWLIVKKFNLKSHVFLEINSLGKKEERDQYKKQFQKYLFPFKNKLSKDSQIRLNKNPLRIWDSKEEEDQDILKKAPLLIENLDSSSLQRYSEIKNLLKDLKIPFKEKPQLVRGLDYYNDLVFEWTSSQLGSQSALIAGGRYDTLVEQLGGIQTPAVGWALGLERLNLLCPAVKKPTLQIALISSGEGTQKAYKLAYQLRSEGYSVYYRFSGNFSKQMKRASSKCLWFLIYGQKEQKQESIILKNLKTKKQVSLALSDLSQELNKRLNSLDTC